MTDHGLLSRLDLVAERLAAIEARLARLEASADRERALRDALEHERTARRALTDQVEWLADFLGRSRDEIRHLRGG
ncbi:MAG: hypothetical protein IPM29_09525 [Planctomycetes bacterium]|nr:hypothetical protein [Planctomycetota bacterium]